MNKGLFISFEGPDASGKSTQIYMLRDMLEERDYETLITREPGGTQIGERIRDIILDPANNEMTDVCEMMLYAASRAQHVAEVIKPNLEKGRIVISDRFLDSSIVYQGGARGLGLCVEEVNKFAVDGCVPDITFLLTADPQKLMRRDRGREDDRIEAEGIKMQMAVKKSYDDLAEAHPERIKVLDASADQFDIASQISEIVLAYLNGKTGLKQRQAK